MSIAAHDNLNSHRISVRSMTSGIENRTDVSAFGTEAARNVPSSVATWLHPRGPFRSAMRRATSVCFAMLIAVSSIAFHVFADSGAALRLNHSSAMNYLLPSVRRNEPMLDD